MNLPTHVAIVVDGNRRWAKKRGLPNIAGHRKAANEIMKQLIYHCLKLNISYITFWVWSTENWKRGEKFANMLFNILRLGLKRNISQYIKDGIKLNTIGDLTKLPKNLVKEIEKVKQKSKNNKKLVVTIAINYGGRDEIIRTIKKLVQDYQEKGIFNSKEIDNLTVKQFSSYLDTADIPDPDLIIRTGGEQRLSGFLLWQAEYAEFCFTQTLFPDFDVKEFNKALKEYARRQRRFGQ